MSPQTEPDIVGRSGRFVAVDLYITRSDLSYPTNAPYLRIHPANGKLEFRFVDTPDSSKQWYRAVETTDSWPRFLKFLEQLGWFPTTMFDGQ